MHSPSQKQFLSTLLLCTTISPFFASCGPINHARLTAQLTKQTILEYDTALKNVKIAEEIFYDDIASATHEARLTLFGIGLTSYRLLETSRYADYLAEDPEKRATRTGMYDFFLRVTNGEHEQYRRLEEQANNARTDTLKSIAKFDNNRNDIAAVTKALDELSQNRSLTEQGQYWATFIQNLRKELDSRKTKANK